MECSARDDPNNASIAFELGVLYFDLGDFAKSTTQYTKVLSITPNDVRAEINLAVINAAQEKLPEAMDHFKRAEELKPDHPDIYSNRGWIYFLQKRLDDAINDYTRSLNLEPQDADTLFKRALAYKDKYYLENAIQDLNNAINIAPQLSRAIALRRELIDIRSSIVRGAYGLYIPNPRTLFY